jgi:hypothetical protein
VQRWRSGEVLCDATVKRKPGLSTQPAWPIAAQAWHASGANAEGCLIGLEASEGIEPPYKDLQSSA